MRKDTKNLTAETMSSIRQNIAALDRLIGQSCDVSGAGRAEIRVKGL